LALKAFVGQGAQPDFIDLNQQVACLAKVLC
jgi:hypothetical protein